MILSEYAILLSSLERAKENGPYVYGSKSHPTGMFCQVATLSLAI
jgi:hypothetical protein